MKKIGLVFEGGGMKGSYQVGSYYAFLDCHYKISGIVGSSVGSLNAAAIVCGKYEELMATWQDMEPAKLFGLHESYVRDFLSKKHKIEDFFEFNKDVFSIIKNRGIDIEPLRKLITSIVDEDKLRVSKMDFGLATVKFKSLTPYYLFKEDIEKGKLVDYLLASCYLPVFRMSKLIDNNYYFDGGFYDNTPTSMLIDKNYDRIFEIKIDGVGFNRSVDKINNDIVTIRPSRNIVDVLEMDECKLKENIKMGYYDTLRVLKKYDGTKYCFKKRGIFFYKLICRKVDWRLLRRVEHFFNVDNCKDAVIKSIEYVFENDNVNYYDVYGVYSAIKIIKRKFKNDKFIYKFINQLSIF